AGLPRLYQPGHRPTTDHLRQYRALPHAPRAGEVRRVQQGGVARSPGRLGFRALDMSAARLIRRDYAARPGLICRRYGAIGPADRPAAGLSRRAAAAMVSA